MIALLTHPLVKTIWGCLLLAFVSQLLFAQPGPWLTRLCLGVLGTAAYLVALACEGALLWEVLRAPQTPGDCHE